MIYWHFISTKPSNAPPVNSCLLKHWALPKTPLAFSACSSEHTKLWLVESQHVDSYIFVDRHGLVRLWIERLNWFDSLCMPTKNVHSNHPNSKWTRCDRGPLLQSAGKSVAAPCASGKLGRSLGATGKQTAADVTNLRNEHGSLMLFAAFSLESLGVTRCISWHWVILETLMQQNHFRHWWIQKVLR